jgi:dynein heavy chain
VTFSFEVLKYETDVSKAPENGCYVKGLYLEGAGWDNKNGVLEEAQPKCLFLEMPALYFLPVLEKEESLDAKPRHSSTSL